MGLPAKQIRGGGSGDGKDAVLGLDGAAADVDGGAADFVDVEQIERDAGADDIGDGIGRADFVEVDFFDRDAVDLASASPRR